MDASTASNPEESFAAFLHCDSLWASLFWLLRADACTPGVPCKIQLRVPLLDIAQALLVQPCKLQEPGMLLAESRYKAKYDRFSQPQRISMPVCPGHEQQFTPALKHNGTVVHAARAPSLHSPSSARIMQCLCGS